MSETPLKHTYPEQLVNLISRYGFDLEGLSPETLINQWLQEYPSQWIYLAILEALHQGRYKIISVQQILKLWLRRSFSSCHFSPDFESMINNTVEIELPLASPSPTPVAEIEQPIITSSPDEQLLSEPSIGQFIPLIDASDFYHRLKSVAKQNTQV